MATRRCLASLAAALCLLSCTAAGSAAGIAAGGPGLPPAPAATLVNRWDYATPSVLQPGPRAWHTAVNYTQSLMAVYAGISLTGVGAKPRAFFLCYRCGWGGEVAEAEAEAPRH